MKNLNKQRRMASAAMACALTLALSVAAVPAYAAAPYTPEAYRVTVYAGNNGTVSLGEGDAAASVALDGGVALNDTADFSSLQYHVTNDKYYVKGIRLAGLDNIRSDKNTDEVDAAGNPINVAGVDTVLYAMPTADGSLVNTDVRISEDTDFVVAYGILANRVSYTVNYVDADGNPLHDPQTFFGDIGDRPATAPIYIENYVPDASLVLLTLSEDEANNVVAFRYTRLAEGASTVQQPSGRVDVVVPNGSTATGVYTTAPTTEEVAVAGAAPEAAAPATDETTTAGVDGPAAEGSAATPVLTTDDGTQVLAADGTPLATPEPQTINDDENALAGAANDGLQQDAQAASWWPWALAAAVIAATIVFIVVRARKMQKEDTSSPQV